MNELILTQDRHIEILNRIQVELNDLTAVVEGQPVHTFLGPINDKLQALWQTLDQRSVEPKLICRCRHDEIFAAEKWIIDGWGGWPLIERRFALADTIIFIDSFS